MAAGRRRKPQEFLLADGRRVLVALPEEAEVLRAKYKGVQREQQADGGGVQVEVVVHGSAEHQQYLQEKRDHQQARREALRAQHGSAFFDEWDRVTAELSQASDELSRLSDQSASLGEHFSKFGYSATLRTFGGDEGEGSGHGSRQISRLTSRANSLGSSSGDGEESEEDKVGMPTWHDTSSGEGMRIFERPTVKQYFHRGLLWRASSLTEVQSFELFFDLMYVGIIAINGDHAAESANGFELLRFLVTFCLSWKIWSDVTQLVSWFQNNDVMSRVALLFLFSCLLAVTSNMAQTFGGWGETSESSTGSVAERTTEAGAESTESPDTSDTYRALAAYYVTARLFMALWCALMGLLVPLVQGTMACQVVLSVVAAALWIASMHLELPVRLACVFVVLAFDLFGGALVVGAFRYATGHAQTRVGRALVARVFDFYPAVSIEHKVERTNAFMTLVLGYSVVGVLFQNGRGYGLHAFLGKAVLGLVQAFVLNWLYFDVDGAAAAIHVHAIRRGAESAWLWQNAHLLFTLAFVLSSAALSRLVVATDCANAPLDSLTPAFQAKATSHLGLGLRLYYSTGLGVALAAYALIAATHVHKATPHCRLTKPLRLANRLAVAAVLCALPAARHLSSLQLVAIATGLLVWVLAFEVWGTSDRGEPLFALDVAAADGPTSSLPRYTARCSERRLQQALRAARADDEEQPQVDINVLSRGEKHGAALMD
ncbi:hypothetical protein CMQ_4276 [Grosmannia clavigera kw1407]|uniref:Low temperature requirement a protein n=1 Tax=Grosmannia clavigera (strain kw1407 / UAMH 11150) TaxID=655863 RepID=F0XTP3_GROCL|nr:uncharacterized protein CMQ_4276 [Grosmannia clavigera kw1407]EFW98424.1 hypothetical protein CMQ_4276 [Grosmannia clavigera kw1407]